MHPRIREILVKAAEVTFGHAVDESWLDKAFRISIVCICSSIAVQLSAAGKRKLIE